ncbi:MAG: PadR family transcriptional regulator [Candidatus Diapherotrites archaeon]|uniref:PadR family transcriptional regulator n=1 Tax=Candidatus Iainarchaeum sp. TaxID=3101447 RepID=A0A8T3YNL8_9ARCH|nr:PadR family transcriptional regulator [Candidatus Diapherotrites archaeon]
MGHSEKGGCCDMRGMLSFLMLFLLSKKSMHGQEIADELEKRKGERPSPGTIYPALKGLKETGFVSERKEGKTIMYSLTAEGRKALKASKEKFCRTFIGLF